jgi:PAS domain S-box-containing protein
MPVEARGLKLQTGGKTEVLNVHIRPVLRTGDSAKGLMLIIFEPDGTEVDPGVRLASDESLAKQLEEELIRVKAQLRASNEQHDFQAEEMKASNEELQAMNEELRSAAEELETSKEELQSINEELRTVNQELKIKIEEISIAGNNLHNLIGATDIGIIFLDRSLRVSLYTPAATEIFHLIPADFGRPLSDITTRLEDENMLIYAESVLEKLQPVERDVRTKDNKIFLMRITPFRTDDDRINGVVMSFVDLTERRQTEEDLRVSQEKYRSHLEQQIENRTKDLSGMQRLYDLNIKLAIVTDFKESLEEIIAVACEFMNTNRGCIQLVSEEGEKVEMFACKGFDEHDRFIQHFLHTGNQSDSNSTPINRSRVIIEDVEKSDTLLSGSDREVALSEGIHAIQSTPIYSRNGELLGVLSNHFNKPTRPDDYQLKQIDLLVWTAGVYIQQHNASKALQISAQRLQRMVNVEGVGVLTFEPSGVLVSANNAFLKMVGYTRQEFDADTFTWQDFTPPEYVTASLQHIEEIKTSGVAGPYEKQYFRKDGSRTWIMFVAADLGDGTFVKYAVDINNAKRDEQALRISRERLRVTMESAVDFVIITMGKDRIVEQWNTGAERIFGYTVDEMQGKSADILFTDEDRAHNAPEQEIQSALKEGYAIDERWHQRKDGSRFYMSGVVRPIYNPELTGFVKVGRDITSQKDAEQQLRMLEERNRIALQSAEMASWDWNVKENKVLWNEQHYILLGMEPDLEAKTTDYFLQFLHPNDKNQVENALRNAMEESGIYKAEFRIRRKDNNEVRWMSGFGRAIEWNDQKVSRMVGVLYDITERKNLEQQREDFLNIASHELKTPVTSIKAYGEMLEQTFEEIESPESVSLIHKLNSQVNRLNSLISDLLDTTKIAEGQLPLSYEDFNISELITELVDEFQQLSKKHHLVTGCDKNIIVHADSKRIEQVITNLISNAIKYSPNGGQIDITCQMEAEHLKVSVSDHGIGIPEELQDKLFERFFRVRSGISNALPGMGLGLYITSGIIKRHGGTLGVQSEPGKGSVFYFTLPRTS